MMRAAAAAAGPPQVSFMYMYVFRVWGLGFRPPPDLLRSLLCAGPPQVSFMCVRAQGLGFGVSAAAGPPQVSSMYVCVQYTADTARMCIAYGGYGTYVYSMRRIFRDQYARIHVYSASKGACICMLCINVHVFMHTYMYACMCVTVCMYYASCIRAYTCIFCIRGRMCIFILCINVHVFMHTCIYACM